MVKKKAALIVGMEYGEDEIGRERGKVKLAEVARTEDKPKVDK